MGRNFSIRIAPNGLYGFIVYWQEAQGQEKQFKILQNRKQLAWLLEMLLDEVSGKDEEPAEPGEGGE